MSSVKKFAARLRVLRGEKSVYKVAKEMDVHRQLITRYESGEAFPGSETLRIIAQYYKADFAELKMLIFEDSFPEHSEDRRLLLEWVKRLEPCSDNTR